MARLLLFVPVTYERQAQVMGTTVHIKAHFRSAPLLVGQALSEMRRIEKLFSKFDKNSEISRINRGEKIELSQETRECLNLAKKVKQLSKGAFDITLGKGRQIDLGGIGKGYAVEKARKLLLKKGVKSAIINLHSSIAVMGDGWRVGILDPRTQNTGKTLGTVILNDGDALSTSAQYEQPGHLVDPRTGKPADKCLSVTIIAKDAGLADALSTAIFVLGPAEGLQLLKSAGGKGVIVDRKGRIYANFSLKLR